MLLKIRVLRLQNSRKNANFEHVPTGTHCKVTENNPYLHNFTRNISNYFLIFRYALTTIKRIY